MKGYFSLNRSLLDHPIWTSEPFTKGQAWADLIGLANYKHSYIIKRGVKVDITRGCVGWSNEMLSKRWRWSKMKVRRFLIFLENEKMIKTIQQKNKLTTIISITNYNIYQSGDTTNDTTNDISNDTGNDTLTIIKEINKDNNINVCVGESQIFNSILSFFGFTPQNNPDKATHVSHFVNTLLQNGQLEHFKSQFEAYKEYKAKTSEKTHGFGSFLGEQAQSYTNGGWNAQNWKNKLKQAENKPAPGYPPARPRKKTFEEVMREVSEKLGTDYDKNPFKNI